MSCEDDVPTWNRAISGSSHPWQHREPASRALLHFDLYFDRNQWPAAQAQYIKHPETAPGIDHPSPSADQIAWLLEDVQADLKDLAGLGSSPQPVHVELLGVKLDPPGPPLIQGQGAPQLWMRLRMEARLEEEKDEDSSMSGWEVYGNAQGSNASTGSGFR